MISVIIICLVTVLVGFLVVEYRFFKHQSYKILDIRDDYRNYLSTIKKVLTERNKEKMSQGQSSKYEEEKKKPIENLASTFPAHARVFSSDSKNQDDVFLIINREAEYLKDSFARFIKDQQLDFLLKGVNLDRWRDYNEQVLVGDSQEKPSKKVNKRRGKIRTAVVKKQNLQVQRYRRERAAKRDMVFSWPIERSRFHISSVFGLRKKPDGRPGFHQGIDMAALRGTPVKAAASGVIIEAGNMRGYGKTIVVAHNRKYRTRYAHLNTIYVSVGQKVDRGDCIGKVGSTGRVRSSYGGDPSHLHFEVSAFGKRVNPMYYLV